MTHRVAEKRDVTFRFRSLPNWENGPCFSAVDCGRRGEWDAVTPGARPRGPKFRHLGCAQGLHELRSEVQRNAIGRHGGDRAAACAPRRNNNVPKKG